MLVCRDCGRPRESNERVCPDCGADGWIAEKLRARLARPVSGPLDRRAARQRREVRRVFQCLVSDDQVTEAFDYFDNNDWRDVARDVVELQMKVEPRKRSPVEWAMWVAVVVIWASAWCLWVTIRRSQEPRGVGWAEWAFLGLLALMVWLAEAAGRRIAVRLAKVQFASSLQELCERFYPMALSVPHPERPRAPKASALFSPVLPLVPPPVWSAYRSASPSSESKGEAVHRDPENPRCPHCGHQVSSPQERPLVCDWCGRGLRNLGDVHRMWWSVRSTLDLPQVEVENARSSRRPGAGSPVVDLEVDLALMPPGRVTFRTTTINVGGHWFLISPEPGHEITETDTPTDAQGARGL